jgi:hypothetical protein
MNKLNLTQTQIIEVVKILCKNDIGDFYNEINPNNDLITGGISWYRNGDDTPVDKERYTIKKTKTKFIAFRHSGLNHDPAKDNCIAYMNFEFTENDKIKYSLFT